MDDRKTRIEKLSERFKPDAGRSKRSAKQRERRSYYLVGANLIALSFEGSGCFRLHPIVS